MESNKISRDLPETSESPEVRIAEALERIASALERAYPEPIRLKKGQRTTFQEHAKNGTYPYE